MARVPARRKPPPVATSDYPGVNRAIAYANGVIAGKTPVCQLVHRACERFLRDLDEATAGTSEWRFDPRPAEAKIFLAEMLPNIKGPLAGLPLELQPWQCFVYANLFGFYERGSEARRYRQGVVYVPRGNGKTTFAAPIVLGMTFCEDEGGAEGYAAAVSRDQARILFDVAAQMVKRSPAFRRHFGVEAMTNSVYQERSASRFSPVSSDAKALDGLNVHIAVCDEIASHKTSEVYDVLLTAMGKRDNPMLLAISTATGNTSGIGRQLWDYCIRVLTGGDSDERLFALIYTIDEGDDVWDELTWIKANPNWGISVQPNAIRAIMRQARNNASQEAVAMTRHLNVWVGADDALFSSRAWRACTGEIQLDDYAGKPAHIAIDLASKTDLAAVSITFPDLDADTGKITYATFSLCFLNEAAVMEARNASYPGWAADGWLTITDGNETDFSVIEDAVLDLVRRFDVQSVAYDPWAATQFAQRLTAEGVPMVEYRATTQNFSEPTKELDAAIQAGRIQHNGNPVLDWCIGNVVGRYDARSNIYPKKSRPENKIDCAIALIMTVGRSMAANPVSSYNTAAGRDLLVV